MSQVNPSRSAANQSIHPQNAATHAGLLNKIRGIVRALCCIEPRHPQVSSMHEPADYSQLQTAEVVVVRPPQVTSDLPTDTTHTTLETSANTSVPNNRQRIREQLSTWVDSASSDEDYVSREHVKTKIIGSATNLSEDGPIEIQDPLELSDQQISALPDNIRFLRGLTLKNCPNLTDLSAVIVDYKLTIINCANISTLPKTKEIFSNVTLENCPNLTDLSAVKVRGQLNISNCAKLSALPKIYLNNGNEVTLNNCPSLSDLSALEINQGDYFFNLTLIDCPQLVADLYNENSTHGVHRISVPPGESLQQSISVYVNNRNTADDAALARRINDAEVNFASSKAYLRSDYRQ
jgi:hypothetical protein